MQPVAVGANGEIGYIAVAEGVALPEQPVVAAPVAIAEPVAIAIQPQEAAAVDYVYAESERMKHELVILQQKISDLNVAQQNYQLMHHQQLLQQQQQQVSLDILTIDGAGVASILKMYLVWRCSRVRIENLLKCLFNSIHYGFENKKVIKLYNK